MGIKQKFLDDLLKNRYQEKPNVSYSQDQIIDKMLSEKWWDINKAKEITAKLKEI